MYCLYETFPGVQIVATIHVTELPYDAPVIFFTGNWVSNVQADPVPMYWSDALIYQGVKVPSCQLDTAITFPSIVYR